MYFDTKPCAVCGSEVELRGRQTPPVNQAVTEPAGPVGEPDGVVGTADATVDERVCTNPECATNDADRRAETPNP